MKALTLWRPWSCCIVRGPKNVENRGWFFPRAMLGQTIAIHGGRTWDSALDLDDLRAQWPAAPIARSDSPEGIVGVARLSGAIDVNASGDPFIVCGLPGVHVDIDGAWWGGGRAWVLDGRRDLATPVPCKGAQGLWTVPPDVEARVREQLR